MRLLSLCCLCLVLLTACEGGARERRAARGEDYVSDPDHLYFRNIRGRDYRSRTIEEGVDRYVHDDLGEEANLYILDRWLEDRAELVWDDRILTAGEVSDLQRTLQSEPGGHLYPEAASLKAAQETVGDYRRLTGQ